MNHKIFHYYPVDVKNSYTGVNVKGFKFPANGTACDATNAADVENLQQMQIYFGVHSVIASLQDLMRVGTKKTNALYTTPLLGLSWNCPVLELSWKILSQDKNKNAFFLLNFMNLKQILTGII